MRRWLLLLCVGCATVGGGEVAQQVTVTAKGLFTSPNHLGEVPDGALRQADNVVISKDGVIQPKRGGVTVTSPSPLGGALVRMAAWKNVLLSYDYASTPFVYGAIWASNVGVTSWVDAGSAGARSLTGPRPRFQVAKGNLFYTGTEFVSRYNSVSATTTYFAGYQAALDTDAASAGAGTAVANNTAVAYRVVWGFRDLDGTEVLGPPSGRVVFTNTTGGTVNVTVTATTPPILVASGIFYRVYRSASVPSGSTPSDELGLVYEADYTVPATSVSFTDIIPEALLGATIYTAPSQEGIANANYAPPSCADLAYFKESMFYANCISRASDTAILIDVNAATGMVVGDTVVVSVIIGGVTTYTQTFTAAAAENIAAAQFLLSAGGSATNIETTALSLIRVINRNSWLGRGIVSAEYLSGDNDQPGIVRLFSTYSAEYRIQMSCSRASAFRGLPIDKYPTTEKAHLYWSKQNAPDAVPLLNYAVIGESDNEISRVVATRDALFIFKTDGIWRLTGAGGVWDIQPLDPTTTLVAPESAVPFENAVFALCDSGVMRITESGVENISGPIYSPDLEPLLLPSVLSTTASVSFGIAYHSDHKYILWMPSAAGDTVAKQAFVYDSWTNSWVRWTPPDGVTGFYHGLVNPADDRLYMTDGTNIWQERRTGASADHTDGASSAITTTVKWAPRVGGNPGAMHRFREVSLHFRKVQFGTATLGFSTDVSPSEETITLSGSEYGCSASERGQTVIRALVPLEKARGSQLNVRFSSANAGMGYELEGMSVVFNSGSTRVGR